MGFSPNALYQALLVDLREHLDLSPEGVSLDILHALGRDNLKPTGADLSVLQAMGNHDLFVFTNELFRWSPDSSLKQAAAANLMKSIFKRYTTSRQTTPDQNTAAIKKFESVNEVASNWVYSPNTSGDEELMGSVKEHIYHFWNPQGSPLVTNPLSLFDQGMVGPGASIAARGEDYYTKMWSSPLSATSESLSTLYWWWCSENPLYAHAESQRRLAHSEVVLTKQNRLSFVPKDDITSRTIATEPSLNMFVQRGLGEILTSRLRHFFGISLDTQPTWNREAARIGSEGDWNSLDLGLGSNSLCTIDLSSASDSFSVNAARWLLPRDLFDLLMKLRCPTGILPDGRPVSYHMVSTMGNGFTFPLQTLVFASIVVTAIKSLGHSPDRPNIHPPAFNSGSWGVFGDDIICHQSVVQRVLAMLKLFGFTPNSDKTFVEGPFRESCGRDYFYGHDIRGVFVKSPLASRAELHATINNLIAWSYRTGILLPSVGRYLTGLLSSMGRILYVPLDEGLASGVRVPVSVLQDLITLPPTNKNGSFLYKRLLAVQKQLRIGDGYISVPKGARKRYYNPEGLMLAFLHGSVRTGRISVRQRDTRYRTKGCVTPNWDYVPPTSDLLRHVGDRLDQRRLEIASRVFLGELIKS